MFFVGVFQMYLLATEMSYKNQFYATLHLFRKNTVGHTVLLSRPSLLENTLGHCYGIPLSL